MSITLDPPRWPGGPAFCPACNRMAFPDQAALHAYRKTIGMDGHPPGKLWRCGASESWHYEGLAPTTKQKK